MSNVLSIKNVTMQFGGVVAVNDLSLEVNEGEIVALIGPNGAGKTTAFNCVTGVYQPVNGVVEYMGKTIVAAHPTGKMKHRYMGENADMFIHTKTVSPTPDRITKLGIARTFQNIRLFKSMTVMENVLVAMHMRRKSNFFISVAHLDYKEDIEFKKEAEDLLKTVGLYENRDEMATALPYGLQRRLEIARALATAPKLLLLDEPAAGMNPQETLELGEFIVEIKKKYGLTILMIEHHMDLVMQFSDRIYVIDFGKLIANGLPEDIKSDPKVIKAYLGVDE